MNQQKTIWVIIGIVVLIVFTSIFGRDSSWKLFGLGFGWLFQGLVWLLALIVLVLAAIWLYLQIKKGK